MWKKLLIGTLIPVALVFLAAVGVGTWYFFIRETPEDVLQDTVNYARQRNTDAFKTRFSSASVRALEGSWTGENSGAGGWASMMEGILERNGGPPEVLETEIVGERAKIEIKLEGRRRSVFLIQDDGDWRIDVLSGIQVGLSDEARKAQAKTTAENPEEADKEKELLEEPKRENWWKE